MQGDGIQHEHNAAESHQAFPPPRGRKAQGETTAVKDLTFEIPDGMLVGLLGPSGCGKSTTLNMICGLETPTSGKIFFGEEDVTALPPELRGVGMVFQNYALYPHLTVLQNILFPLENLKGADRPSRKEMRRRAMETAQLVQIEDLLDRKPKELSGGQQQRVAIARALVKMPGCPACWMSLFPTWTPGCGCRPGRRSARIQKKTGITTVFVTHDQEEAMSISDRIVVMKEGVVHAASVSPQEVYDQPVNLFVAQFLGTPPINVFEGTVQNGVLNLAGQAVLKVPGAPDAKVFVGIRPGRVCAHGGRPLYRRFEPGGSTGPGYKHCVRPSRPARQALCGPSSTRSRKWTLPVQKVRFSLRPDKVFLFHWESQERIPFDTAAQANA